MNREEIKEYLKEYKLSDEELDEVIDKFNQLSSTSIVTVGDICGAFAKISKVIKLSGDSINNLIEEIKE